MSSVTGPVARQVGHRWVTVADPLEVTPSPPSRVRAQPSAAAGSVPGGMRSAGVW
ncbi:hypothetical protein [Nonomuraea sp. NPDC048901]|uniref:hypothetical protein n=1 Tax=Nonomuraea sp. NPDC048901 TaxID=3155627 RepID=UPI0033E14630